MLEQHSISTSASILEALHRLNSLPSGASMTLIAIDGAGHAAGTVTDGDLRRGLLRGLPLDAPVSETMHRTFRHISEGQPGAVEEIRAIRSLGIRLIPVTDAEGRLTDIIDTDATPNRLPIGAILMAGGRGERLRPLTLSTPKPLLRVGDRPIIEYNIRALVRMGVSDITVTTNYLAEQIEEYFRQTRPAVHTVREPFAMGTLGSATLCRVPEEGDTLVMNADLLTNISLEDLYLHHRAMKADITMAAIPYNVSVPFAILSTDHDRPIVNGLREKPSYSYLANAGIYLISNRLLSRLPAGERTDAPDFIEEAIASGATVTFYPISGTWIDIGSPTDYQRACELMETIRVES